MSDLGIRSWTRPRSRAHGAIRFTNFAVVKLVLSLSFSELLSFSQRSPSTKKFSPSCSHPGCAPVSRAVRSNGTAVFTVDTIDSSRVASFSGYALASLEGVFIRSRGKAVRATFNRGLFRHASVSTLFTRSLAPKVGLLRTSAEGGLEGGGWSFVVDFTRPVVHWHAAVSAAQLHNPIKADLERKLRACKGVFSRVFLSARAQRVLR